MLARIGQLNPNPDIDLYRYLERGVGDTPVRQIFPPFSGNYNELQDVPQMSWQIATHESEKPVLATSGLSNCIGVVAYDRRKKLAFLSHSDSFSCACGRNEWDSKKQDFVYVNVNGDVRSFYRRLTEMEGEFELDVKMIIGNYPDKEMIDITRRTIEKTGDRVRLLNLERIDMGQLGSVAIDARTGKLFTYDPELNPNPKTKGVWDRIELEKK